MKNLAKYLLVSVLAFCCAIGLVACGGGKDKRYMTGRFELANYDLNIDGQKVVMNADNVNSDTTGSNNQYFIELDGAGNMKIVFIELSYSTTTEKYNLAKSDEKEYTYYIKSSNKIVVKDGKATVSYDININETLDVIMFYGPKQTGNAQIISKFEKAG